jgi:hypothetical protein
MKLRGRKVRIGVSVAETPTDVVIRQTFGPVVCFEGTIAESIEHASAIIDAVELGRKILEARERGGG